MSGTHGENRAAVYGGSFDPPTFGHLNLIERGARLFDRLVVAVGNNPRKTYTFSVEERIAMLEASLGAFDHVVVQAFDSLLVDFCHAVGAKVLLRGLRAVGDFEFEFQMGLANMDFFLIADPETLFVSSSVVKEIAGCGRDVRAYVPEHVARALMERLCG